MNTIAGEMTAHRFFAGMDAEHLEVLTGCARNVVIPAGASIIREGADAGTFWASGPEELRSVSPRRVGAW